MNCDEARQRWHDRLDEDRDDPALDSHLASCGACRCYAGQMGRIAQVLDELRDETESVFLRQEGGSSDRGEAHGRRSWRVFLRPAMGIAAAAAVAISASLFYLVDQDGTIVAPISHPVEEQLGDAATEQFSVSPRLGISLRGESAQCLLAVAQPVSQDNVQVFWLYRTLASDSKGGP